jgi:hypothetical protein
MQVVSKQQIGTTVMKSILFNVFPLCTTQIHLVCILALETNQGLNLYMDGKVFILVFRVDLSHPIHVQLLKYA